MDLNRWIRNEWDRALALVMGIAGLIALLVGWLGVSDEVLPAAQIPYLASGGMLGLFLLGAGATLWLSADLRDEWRKLDDVATEIHEAAELLAARDAQPAESSSNGTHAPARRNGRLVAASRTEKTST